MKTIISVLIVSCFVWTGSLFAQQKRTFLLPDYLSGSVLMLNGSRVTTLLNYDAANRAMMYKEKEDEMILVNIQSVDTVYIGSRKFIPAGNSLFLEVVPVSHGTVYINWNLESHLQGKAGAYGQVSQSKVETVNTSYWTNNAYRNELFEVYDQTNKNEYWLFRKGKPVKCKNEKTLLKLFPGKEEQTRTYIKQNKLDFGNANDVIRLLDYCLAL